MSGVELPSNFQQKLYHKTKIIVSTNENKMPHWKVDLWSSPKLSVGKHLP